MKYRSCGPVFGKKSGKNLDEAAAKIELRIRTPAFPRDAASGGSSAASVLLRLPVRSVARGRTASAQPRELPSADGQQNPQVTAVLTRGCGTVP